MRDSDIERVMDILGGEMEKWELPAVKAIAEKRHNPFKILISTILSSRTKDEITAKASEKLFNIASSPEDMVKVSHEEILRAIYPVGFYRNKARMIRQVCEELIKRFDSRVPDTIEELLSLKGVGRKTANLVVSLAYNKEAVCVDTHVHRISNRLGYLKTKNPKETELFLRKKLPLRHWSSYNTLMVAFGRKVCRPVSPLCSICPVRKYCDRINVIKSR